MLNRANGRLRLFKKDDDFAAFEKVLVLAHQRVPIRILDWVLMSNHWHMVLWPRRDGELTAFLRWLTLTHAQRWKHAHNAVGHGHLYQGRFKSFPVQDDRHLLTVLRYVERNPVRAKRVDRAQDWQWGSCHVRQRPRHPLASPLTDWPVDRPRNWLEMVNRPPEPDEEGLVKLSIDRSRPLGDESWMRSTVRRLHLEQSLRPRGRPPGWRKKPETGAEQ